MDSFPGFEIPVREAPGRVQSRQLAKLLKDEQSRLNQGRLRTVSQANTLVMASYVLTLTEKRIILYAASHLDSMAPLDPANGKVTFSAKEFADYFMIDKSGGYTRLNEGCHKLFDRRVVTFDEHDRLTETRWVWKAVYDKGQGRVHVHFTPDALGWMTNLTGRYTSTNMIETRTLTSFHSIRFHELFSQYVSIGAREISVSDIRRMFNLYDSYATTGELFRAIVAKSVNEINKKTNLNVSILERKEGKKIVGWIFQIEKKESPQQSLLD